MKKIFLLAVLFCAFGTGVDAQDKKEAAPPPVDTTAPYWKFPTLPAFNILMMDSVTVFNTYNIPKGGTIGIFMYSPDCGHCHRTMKRMTDSMDMLKDIRFYIVTPYHNMSEIRKFVKEFHLDTYENVKLIGRDTEFFLGSFYGITYVPDLALYDGNKKLIKLIKGETSTQTILDVLHAK